MSLKTYADAAKTGAHGVERIVVQSPYHCAFPSFDLANSTLQKWASEVAVGKWQPVDLTIVYKDKTKASFKFALNWRDQETFSLHAIIREHADYCTDPSFDA
jgi:hypothetical protein